MVDKNYGLIERGLDRVIDGYYKGKEKTASLIRAGGWISKAVIAILCLLLAVMIYFVATATKTVTVVTDTTVGTKTQQYEVSRKINYVEQFLACTDIGYDEENDIIYAKNLDKIQDGTVIKIKKARRIYVVHDGVRDELLTQEDSVSDMLRLLGLHLREFDTIDPGLNDIVVDRDEIVLKRIDHVYSTKDFITSYETYYVADSSMTIGKVEVTQDGRTGIKRHTYLSVYEDGVRISKKRVKVETVSDKHDKIISYGTRILSGTPSGLSYVSKIDDARVVSYWFSGNPHGAYGLKCEYGTCAVDKDVIPLGSLIYVEGYGYAIANDVGSGVKGNTVDLYMEKLSQCGIWGARWADVYIIRYGP